MPSVFWPRRTIGRTPHTPCRPGSSCRPRLEPLEGRCLPSVYTVTNTNDDNSAGSLRWAINQANADPGPDTIAFDIGTGAQTISPASALPEITDPVLIDGTTQPGYGGAPLIELAGTNAGANVNGLTVRAGGSGSTVQGLVINRFRGSGILLTASDNVVQGNYLGTDRTGRLALGNGFDGVTIFGGASGNRVGTDGDGTGDSAEGNLISANGWNGVGISGAGTDHNVVAGNYLGTDVTGTAGLGNGQQGVAIFGGARANRVGADGADPDPAAESNLISANAWGGVGISGTGTDDNVVAGNSIGTDVTGTQPLRNRQRGVVIFAGARSNRVGTDGDGVGDEFEGNVISGNVWEGVLVDGAGTDENLIAGNTVGATRDGSAALPNLLAGVDVRNGARFNRITANSIFGNGRLGIDLGGDGVTVNHVGDAITGPNQLQNYPVLTVATPGPTTTVGGTLTSLPGLTFTLEFFAGVAPHTSGFGEGQRYLGSTAVTTDGSGNAAFTATLPAATSAGEWVTATATDPWGDTSEFSAARPLPTAALTLSTTTWTAVGPAPLANGDTFSAVRGTVSGRISGVAADPTDPDTIYVSAASGGVWKTTDGGAHWTPLTDDQPTLFMGAVALVPSDPQVIYAGTGESVFSGDSQYGRGVLKSTDGGATWALLGNDVFDRRAVAQVVVDPADPDVVYVATGPGLANGLAGNVGVWKSTDGGQTWADTTRGIAGINRGLDLFSDLVLDPGDATHQTLYTAVCSPFGRSAGFSAGSGVYKTTDGGATWSLLGGGMPSGPTVGRVRLAPGAPQTVYASLVGTGRPGSTPFGSLFKMMKTTDGGSTWRALTGVPDYFASGNQGWYDSTLAVSPSDPDVVFAGGSCGETHLIESTDGGTTWANLTGLGRGGGPHCDHQAAAFDARGRFLDANDGGLWRLDDPDPAGPRWTSLNGDLQITQFIGIALHPTDPGIAFGGSQDNGTAIFNGALGWVQARGGDGGRVRVDGSNPARVYHTYQFTEGAGFLERSDDGGSHWAAKTAGINTNDAARFEVPYVIDPVDPARLLLGTYRVYQTTDYADRWAPISNPGERGWPATISDPIDSIAVAASDPRTVYVAVNGHVLVTFDNGASWRQRDIPGAVDHLAQVKVDPADNLIAYAVRDQFDRGVQRGHVFRTGDGGQTWADITGDLPDLPTHCLAIDPDSGTIYVGNDGGVYSSADLGATWGRFAAGLPNVQVVELEWNPGLHLLAAGTHGRGLWEILVGGSGYELPPPAPGGGPAERRAKDVPPHGPDRREDRAVTTSGLDHLWAAVGERFADARGEPFRPDAWIFLLPEASPGQARGPGTAASLASLPGATPAQGPAVDRVFAVLPGEGLLQALPRRKPSARHPVFVPAEQLTDDRPPPGAVEFTPVGPG